MARGLFLLLFFIISFAGCERQNNSGFEIRLKNLFDKKEYFKLREELARAKDEIPEAKFKYFLAITLNTFNEVNKSIYEIDRLISKHSQELGDSATSTLLLTQLDNYVKAYRYSDAYETGVQLLNDYHHVLDSMTIRDISNTNALWEGLSDIPAQRVSFLEESNVRLTRDKVNLLNVPIHLKGEHNFIFDTGANLSTIQESLANNIGLKIIDVKLDVGSSTGSQVQSKVGIADTVLIGNMIFTNVVFLVLPDEQLTFLQIDYVINGIIGFPVIEAMKEINLSKNGTLHIPKLRSTSDLRNLALDGLMPILSLPIENDTLCFQMDTGAKVSSLSNVYFNRYKSKIESMAKLDTINIAGAGGSSRLSVYVLDNFKFVINNKELVLSSIDVNAEPVGIWDNKFYGTIGQDVFSEYETVTINFESMFVTFID